MLPRRDSAAEALAPTPAHAQVPAPQAQSGCAPRGGAVSCSFNTASLVLFLRVPAPRHALQRTHRARCARPPRVAAWLAPWRAPARLGVVLAHSPNLIRGSERRGALRHALRDGARVGVESRRCGSRLRRPPAAARSVLTYSLSLPSSPFSAPNADASPPQPQPRAAGGSGDPQVRACALVCAGAQCRAACVVCTSQHRACGALEPQDVGAAVDDDAANEDAASAPVRAALGTCVRRSGFADVPPWLTQARRHTASGARQSQPTQMPALTLLANGRCVRAPSCRCRSEGENVARV